MSTGILETKERPPGSRSTPLKTPVINVCTNFTLEYVLECLAVFNRNERKVRLTAVGQCISKAVEVSNILKSFFGIKVKPSDIYTKNLNNMDFTGLEISLTCERMPEDRLGILPKEGMFFLEYPVYHLLLDSILSGGKEIVISSRSKDVFFRLLSTQFTPDAGFKCRICSDEVYQTNGDSLTAAFYRSGILQSPKWEAVGKKLGEHDDVILGVDTNILYNCSITQQILNSIVYTSPASSLHTPNWILIVIPSSVMHEIEQAANVRDDKGFLNFEGRMGYRALQQILTIQHSKEMMGVSLLIVGEANPALDTRVEIQGLRQDFKEAAIADARERIFRKSSAGDTIIRDQFKRFLSQISFHKGAYFLTADKSNAALAQAEGLNSIYYQSPPSSSLSIKRDINPPCLRSHPESINMTIPFGNLVYELAVEFGEIIIGWDNESIKLYCDGRGDNLDHWVHKDLRISKKDFNILKDNYEKNNRFSLGLVKKVWMQMENKLRSWT
jgi:DNA-binding protein Alba